MNSMTALTRLTDWLGRRPALIVVAITGLVAVKMLWPALSTGLIIGGPASPDAAGTVWTYWWSGFALTSGSNPFHGTHNFFPVGQNPVAYYNLFDGFLFAPLIGLLGPINGFNLAALVCLWSAGLGAWVLARSVGASPQAAVVAAVGLETSSYLSVEVQDGRLSQALLVFWLLGLAGLVKMSRGEGSHRLAAATGVAVAGALLVYWYSGFFLILSAVVLWAADLRRLDRARLSRLAVAAVVCAVLTGPYVVSLLMGLSDLPGVDRPITNGLERFHRGEFSLASAIRNGMHWTWPLSAEASKAPDRRIAAGLLVLAGLAMTWRRSGRWRWVALIAVGYVIALGPYLKSASGSPLAWALPYLLMYDYIPAFSRMWWPGRVLIIVMAGISVLAALGLDELRREWKLGNWSVVGLGVLLAVADIPSRNAHLPMLADRAVETDSIYQQLDGPILTTPVLGEDPTARIALWHQLTHHQPILYGLGAHIPGHRPVALEEYVEANRLLSLLSEGGTGEVRPADITRLIQDGFVWAVVDYTTLHPRYGRTQAAEQAELFTTLWGRPEFLGENASAWRIRPITAVVPAELSSATSLSGATSPSGPKR